MPRRSRGAGSVRYNAPRGRYEAVLVVGGVKHTRTVPSPQPNERRKKEAEAVLAKMAAQLGRSSGAHTVKTYLAEWLDFIQPNLAYGTWEGHAGRAKNHITPTLGKIRLEALSTKHVDSLLAKLQKGGMAPSTIGLVRKTLSNALNQAVRWKYIPESPVTLSRAPRQEFRERTTLSPEQALRFLDHVQGDRLEALWNIAACMGLRSGEVRGLTWDAVDSPVTAAVSRQESPPPLPHPKSHLSGRHILRITQTLGYQPGQWDLHDPKTPRSRREVTIPAFIGALLEQHRDAQRFESKTPGYSNPMDLVFTQSWGYPISSQWLNARGKTLMREAGVPAVKFHMLRHCAASLLLAKGVPLRTTQDILGHASPSMTLGIYSHSDQEQRREAAWTIEAWRAQ